MECQTENLCADAGYAGETPQVAMVAAGYTPHVRPRGEARREKIGKMTGASENLSIATLENGHAVAGA